MKKSLRRSFISSVAAVVLIISLFTFGAAAKSESAYSLTVENTCAPSFTAKDSSAGALSFFGDREFDGCYGNQLSGVARELYDSLVKSYATDKTTGEYTYAFDTPFTFTAEISEGSIVMNDELEEIQLELHYAAQAAADAFLYDYPEVFWLKIIKTSYSISASGNFVDGYTGIIDDITITPTEIYDGASDYISEYSSAVSSALGFISVTESRYETLKNIHDYICNNAWYNLVSEQRVHSSEPFFIGDGGVVCEGYAKAFKVLCDRLELPCVLVSGDAGGAHMWNYVQMEDGKWYLVDATWDDQTSGIYYTYFIADATTVGFNDVAISEERTESSDFSGTGIFSFVYPELSSAVYIPHIHEWESDYTVDIEPTCTEKGSKSIHCRTCEATKSVTEIDAGHKDTDADGYCDVCLEDTRLVEKGFCGENVTYKLYNDGALVISGSGKMTDYGYSFSPFFNNAEIKTIDIAEGVTSIGSYTFYGCSGFDSVIISDNVRSIGAYSFKNCSAMEKIEIGNSVAEIGDGAFDGCVSLDKITLPASLVRMGDTFYDCSGLMIEYEGDIYQWMKVEGWETVSDYFNIITKPHIHSETLLGGKSATCTETGLTQGKWCPVCSVITERQEVISAKGHIGGTATCKTKAECSRCDEEYGSLNADNHKSLVTLKAVESTCTKTGLTEGKKCTGCGEVTVAQKTVAKKSHTYKTTTTKATLKKNGKQVTKCTVCGEVKSSKTIYYPKSIKLSATTYTYNGKTKTPSVVVKDSKGNTLKKDTDYTVKYASGRKNPGKYTVTVTFKGKYEGTKKLIFTIKPAKVTLSKLTAGSKQLTATWKTVAAVTGYEVMYSTSSKFTSKTTKKTTVKSAKTKKLTIKKLNKGKKYYIKVRAYKTVDGKKIYGSWSSVKSIKVK